LTIAGDEQVDHTLFDRRFRAGSVTFQLWIERESDVICSYQQLDIGAEQIYWVDGLSSEQVERITTWALNRFQALAPEEIPILTVIELASNTGPEDWRLFVKQRVLPVGIPKMIAVKSEWTPLFASVLPNAKPMDGYEILSRLT